ncbi:TIGR02569 family protein [Saccharothrix texasensis]|uniref:TIGR02569 family protein n=1 Tax=Saccharothrix texasensis TaxID=103734 RepID=UPI001B8765DB|nr:TIGR02569 family protein [Saccharothrix texasensis]
MPRPPRTVLSAFGVTAEPVALPGGRGGTWRAGGVVLKPVDFEPETRWRSDVLAALPPSAGFRVAPPVRSASGDWVVDGWEACRFVPGEPDTGRADDVLRAGIAFHAAVRDVPRPAYLDLRDDPWSVGDRVAWEESPVDVGPAALGLLEPLVAARRPVDLPAQVVHGDLAGNVLFAPDLPPAVIDWPPYWRPASWAAAVVVADCLCWYGAPPALLDRWSHLPAWHQVVLRALIYRIVTRDLAGGDRPADQVRAYRPAVDLVLARLSGPGSPR